MTPNTNNMELAKLWRNIGPFDIEGFLYENPESVDLSLNVQNRNNYHGQVIYNIQKSDFFDIKGTQHGIGRFVCEDYIFEG